MKKYYVGMDLGGTNIKLAIFDEGLAKAGESRLDTEKEYGSQHVLERMYEGITGLLEETGISCPVREVGEFIYRYQFNDSLYEYEYDHVFVGEYRGVVAPNREEIEETAWVSAADLASGLVERPLDYAPWLPQAASIALRAAGLGGTCAAAYRSSPPDCPDCWL